MKPRTFLARATEGASTKLGFKSSDFYSSPVLCNFHICLLGN